MTSAEYTKRQMLQHGKLIDKGFAFNREFLAHIIETAFHVGRDEGKKQLNADILAEMEK